MPFTPFHFGPGLLAKVCVPRAFWFTSFVLANVLIDTEVLYYILRNDPPLHRIFHTYVVGTTLGVVSGGVMFVALRIAAAVVPVGWKWRKYLVAQASARLFVQSVVAGVIGGVSHVFLDSLLYHEMAPYWPFADGNDMAGLVSSGLVHVGCAATGFFGLAFWVLSRE